MSQLRYLLLTLCGWLFLFYNIERLSEPINIASFVYVLTFASAAAIILVRPLHEISVVWLIAGLTPIYLFLKVWFDSPIAGQQLPITVTEFLALIITIVLVRQLMNGLSELRRAVAALTIGHMKEGVPFDLGQGLIYREIRRARLNNRPVALLAIEPTEDSLELSLNDFIREAQKEIIRRYVDARVADLLVNELQDYDVITQRGDHFITLLTETNHEQAQETARRLQELAEERLGLKFKVGAAYFPDEAVTFERLLASAEAKMMRSTTLSENGSEPARDAGLAPDEWHRWKDGKAEGSPGGTSQQPIQA